MRLAKSSRTVIPLALSAVLATCALAQEHPNISPNSVRNELNQPADASQSQPQAQSDQGPSQAEVKLLKKKAKQPAKGPASADAKASANGPTKAPVNATAPAAGDTSAKAPANTTTQAAGNTQTKSASTPATMSAKAPANGPAKTPANAPTVGNAPTNAAAKGPAGAPAKAAEKSAAAAKVSAKAVAANPAKPPVEKTAEEKPVVRRDPFDTLLTKARTTNAAPENLPPGKAGLIVATLRIDGIVRAPNGTIAIVSNSQGRVYFLRDGDKLYDGSVDKISLEAVSFHEFGKDAFGKPLERVVTKRLYPSPGEQQ
jgi:hypothetical protein